MTVNPVVDVEEEIHSFEPANNGAGPLWCHGSTIVVRTGEDVYVTTLETLPDEAPLNNCRWVLYARRADGWRVVHRDETGRTREPCPIAALYNGALLVTDNPTLTESGQERGPAQPTVFRFNTKDIRAGCTRELPVWKGAPGFTEHSYRTVTADGEKNEVLYMQNVGMDVSHMSLLRRDGVWVGVGTLAWPWGGEYPVPQPLRLCYPNVVMRDRETHFFGVGDIVEPIEAWRNTRLEITGRHWDYVFRRLFYAYTPDVARQPFCEWIEVANRDATAGAMRNNDIWLAPDGTAHLVWSETTVDERLRDRFFPDETVAHSLEYAAVRNGEVQARRTLARVTEAAPGDRPHLARFQVTENGTPVLLASFVCDAPSAPTHVYRLATMSSDGSLSDWVDVPFGNPIAGTFLTSTVRGGSRPASTIDVVGMAAGAPQTLRYARIRLNKGGCRYARA